MQEYLISVAESLNPNLAKAIFTGRAPILSIALKAPAVAANPAVKTISGRI